MRHDPFWPINKLIYATAEPVLKTRSAEDIKSDLMGIYKKLQTIQRKKTAIESSLSKQTLGIQPSLKKNVDPKAKKKAVSFKPQISSTVVAAEQSKKPSREITI